MSLWSRLLGRGADPEAQLQRAQKLSDGQRLPEAAEVLRALADQGHPEAQWRLAQCYQRGDGVVQDFIEAVRLLKAAAQQKHLAAQAHLGEIYLMGLGAPASATAAAAARLDNAPADDSLLGQLFPEGISVPQDVAEAAHWNRMAAERGDAGAQSRYGYQCLMGLGTARDLDAARGWLQAAADQDHEGGQFGMGLLHATTDSPLHDLGAALTWFEKAAARGNASAQLCAGQLLLEAPAGVTQDVARGHQLLEEAALSGQADAMYRLGEIHRLGIGVPADPGLAETWLRRAMSRGHGQAATTLVRVLSEGPDPQLETALALCRQAADAGNAQAQFALGQLLLTGRGAAADAAEAATWFGRAAAAGLVDAYASLGALHAAGVGVARDEALARQWLDKAAAHDHPEALYQLGMMQLNDPGAANLAQAQARLEQAAQRAHAGACLALGVLHGDGRHRQQDFSVARGWYERAAQLGNLDALYNLAFLHLQGLGVAQSEDEAVALLRRAAEAGHVAARRALGGQPPERQSPR